MEDTAESLPVIGQGWDWDWDWDRDWDRGVGASAKSDSAPGFLQPITSERRRWSEEPIKSMRNQRTSSL